MTGKITIEIDFDTALPYIKVVNDRQSDDVRDKLINQFRQKLGHSSNWCRVRFDDSVVSGQVMFTIEPITPSQLGFEAAEINKMVDKLQNQPPSPSR